MQSVKAQEELLIKHLEDLLTKGNAHVTLDDALENIPFEILGERPADLPYSIWQLAEHLRIAQFDILDFSRNADYAHLKWPDDYWPKENYPASENAWQQCVDQIKADRKAFIDLLNSAAITLFEPIAHGTGQTLIREALVLADHNSYHTGQIILLRKMLNAWK